jgi:hypothetical protein
MRPWLALLLLALSTGTAATPASVGLADLLGTTVRDPGQERPAGRVHDLVLRDGRLAAVIVARDPGVLDGPPDFLRLPARHFSFASDGTALGLRPAIADPGFLDHHAAPPPLAAGERSLRRLVDRPLALTDARPWARLLDVEVRPADRVVTAFLIDPASEAAVPPLPEGASIAGADEGLLRLTSAPGAPFALLDRWLRAAPPEDPVPGTRAPPGS